MSIIELKVLQKRRKLWKLVQENQIKRNKCEISQ